MSDKYETRIEETPEARIKNDIRTGIEHETGIEEIPKSKMKELTYQWGLANWRLPIFPTTEEQIKHFGKPVSQFSKTEWKYYSKYKEELEYVFEVALTAHAGL